MLVALGTCQGKDLVTCKSVQAFLLLKRNALLGLAVSVLKLPCLDVETDAKNPRKAGTVAKKPRGTDAKNPLQLAPLEKIPLQSEMSPP